MAASEYVSVHSQSNTEEAALALKRTKLKQDSEGERQAPTAIYLAHGLEPLRAAAIINLEIPQSAFRLQLS